jgi:protein-disulfide isomerase
MGAKVTVTEFTDPACPVAFSAEPVRRRLQWVFGGQLVWRRVMVVLDDGTRARGGSPREHMAARYAP